MGPEGAKSFPGRRLVPLGTEPSARARQEIDYGRRGRGYIFGAFQRGVPVQVNCIAMILFGITVLAMVFTTWQQRRAEKMASIRPEQEGAVRKEGERRGR